jgi:prepilin-type N-terminal cleavage/methylation domain-containing protein
MNARTHPDRDTRQGGYTLVEVMMALTILAIGSAGIFSLQTVAIGGNADSANLTAATNIARLWMDHLKTDALSWNTDLPNPPGNGDIADTTTLDTLVAASWTSLTAAPQRRDGEIDAVGGLFCAQAIAAPPVLVGALPPLPGRQVTVRVWWFKGPYQNRAAFPACGAGLDAAMNDDLSRFHWVYLTTLITPHPQI